MQHLNSSGETYMKKIQCEVCGSNDISKTDDNVFECQYCGTKYTLEQARVLFSGEVKTKAVDFEIIGGKLICNDRCQGAA